MRRWSEFRPSCCFCAVFIYASPSFAAWGEGDPLDPGTLLRTTGGKPRAAIVYLAHLSDEERQFVVTLVLSKLVTWMPKQAWAAGAASAMETKSAIAVRCDMIGPPWFVPEDRLDAPGSL